MSATEMEPPSPGTRLSNYRLERMLGSGGMGTVYLARDLALDRPVAIKFIAADKAADESARRRLVREARAAAALDHPNICGVHEVILEPDGRACIVMQYLEGETLAQKLRSGPLEVKTALSIGADIAEGLAAAHARNIVHRDLKPQNVIVSASGRAMLLDFGIAHHQPVTDDNTRASSNFTTSGFVTGTPAYMSPEQAQQRPLDGRSDLFSLGAVLYQCLTGRQAFTGDSPLETLHQVLYVDPPRPSSVRPGLTRQHDELCRRLLAKRPEERFKSAEELLGALRVLSPDSVSFRAPGPSPLALAGLRPFRAARVVGIVAALALALGVAAYGLWKPRGETTARGPTVVGVLPFRNESGDPAHDQLAAGIADVLARRLETVPSSRVVPLEETREAMAEQSDRGRVARTLGAAFVIDGALVRTAATLEIATSVVRPDGERREVGRQPATQNLLDLHQRIVDAVVATLSEEGAVSAGARPHASTPTENAEALAEYSQGRAFLERPDVPGNLDHAIRLFQRSISRDPRFALAHAGLAEAYWAQFRETQDPAWTTKAMAANLDALRIDPSQAEVRMSLAVMYDGMGRKDDAVEELKKVMELQPQNDSVHRLLSAIHISRSEWDSAIAEAKQATALRPTYWRNHSQLGFAYFRAGRYDDAASAYERLVELQPDSARGYQALGTALQAAGKNDEALRRYEQAIAIRPSARTYSNVGTLHFWRREYQKAADAYEKAVTLAPYDAELYANLGDAQRKLGRTALAARSYRRAIDLVLKLLSVSQNDSQYLSALALYQAKLGEHATAAGTLQKALAASPKDGQVLYAGALVHALSGRATDACRVLTEAIASGASPEEIRRSEELSLLKGCEAYDALVSGAGKSSR